ncbi:uncharacterized protein LOC124408197 [Diprion similis]|uniref:uncharacterized protein LOC124408197 n=1 Tax=Diprion similis TaxID=362088 RepID=UPI001EF8E297|nr:uncharacterized protein LOC124408197 [Diprion similis]
MPKKCLICKVEPSPIYERSFHMFPKNESLKQKWLDAINVLKTPNFKTAYICSDHFKAESFSYSNELRQRKRLCKEAVPQQKNINWLNLPRENETKETATIDINYSNISDTTENISSEANTNENEMCKNEVTLTNSLEFHESNAFEDASSQSHLNKDVEICMNKVSSITSLNSQESDMSKDINLQFSTEEVTETYIQELPFNTSKTLDGSTSSSKSNSKERKRSFNDIRTVKRVRFVNGFKTEYVCREDFVNEEAWNRFIRYSAYQRSRIAAAHNKNSRKDKKIKNLAHVIATLDKREEFDAAEYIKVLPSHMKELITRMKERKSTGPFPEKLKTFARTLHFYSPDAYEFVRCSFLKCLPCVQTLNSWIYEKEYNPGISEKTINNVSDIVKQESAKGKKLVFNLFMK